MRKVLVVIGTRPEAIKMAPVIKQLRRHPDQFECSVCVTAQHRDMLDPFLKIFDINPDYDLNIMQPGQTLSHLTGAVLAAIDPVLQKTAPDYVLVQGDTTTSMAVALAAFYRKIKIGHVEAGLRTGNKAQPFPEESNRKIIDDISDLFFAHTQRAKDNLIREGIEASQIEMTGNTVIDALFETADRDVDPSASGLSQLPTDKKIILVTAHRRENFGEPLDNICAALKDIATQKAGEVMIVYPVHLNPRVQEPVQAALSSTDNLLLWEPLDYVTFVHLMKRADLILTDSGGLQEEAPSLGKPVLVLRQVTERPEAVEAGTVKVVGTDRATIVEETLRLLDDPAAYTQMAQRINPYGDGHAAERIIDRLLQEPPQEK